MSVQGNLKEIYKYYLPLNDGFLMLCVSGIGIRAAICHQHQFVCQLYSVSADGSMEVGQWSVHEDVQQVDAYIQSKMVF